MKDEQSGSSRVQHVRTFKDDLRRVEGRGERAHTTVTKKLNESKKLPDRISFVQKTNNPESKEVAQPENTSSSSRPALTASIVPKPEHTSHLSDSNVFDMSLAESGHPEAMVLRDNKKKDWSFGSAAKESLTEWAKEKKESLQEMTVKEVVEEPKVAPSSTRSDIIAAAGQKSKNAPKDDYKNVVAKLRTFSKDTERITGKPFTLKEVPKHTTPQWTHIKGPVNKPEEHIEAKSLQEETQKYFSGSFAGENEKLRPQIAITVPALKEKRKTIFSKSEQHETTPSDNLKEHIAEIIKQKRSGENQTQPVVENIIAVPSLHAKPDVAPVVAQTLPDSAFETLNEQARKVAETVAPVKSDVAPVVAQTLPDSAFETLNEQARKVAEIATPVKSDVAPTVTQTHPETTQLVSEDSAVEPEPTIIEETILETAPVETESAPIPSYLPKIEKRADVTEVTEPEIVPVETKESVQESATRSRDIPFTTPSFEKKATGAFRTLRNDALEEVETESLSVPKIAAAEERRRARETQHVTVRSRKSFLVPAIATILLGIVLTAIGGIIFIWISGSSPKQTDSTTQTATQVSTFVPVATQTAIPFTTSREELMMLLTNAKESTRGVPHSLHHYFLSHEGVEGVSAVTTQTFMDTFDPRTPSSFARNLEKEMMFGVYNSNTPAPFFIFKTTDFETAFAGMLDWEPFMSADLSPLFGEPIRRSFDPSSRTNDNTTRPTFIDSTIRNVDVRILYDEEGTERIFYAFTSKNTFVITSDVQALTALIEAL